MASTYEKIKNGHTFNLVDLKVHWPSEKPKKKLAGTRAKKYGNRMQDNTPGKAQKKFNNER